MVKDSLEPAPIFCGYAAPPAGMGRHKIRWDVRKTSVHLF